MEGMDMSESFIIEEIYQIKPSPEARAELDHLARRERSSQRRLHDRYLGAPAHGDG